MGLLKMFNRCKTLFLTDAMMQSAARIKPPKLPLGKTALIWLRLTPIAARDMLLLMRS